MNAAHRRARSRPGRRHVRCRRATTHRDPCRRSARCRRTRLAPSGRRDPRRQPGRRACWPARSPRPSRADPSTPPDSGSRWPTCRPMCVARAQAEINRLDARLQEAQQASAAGDGPAASAALAAYSVIVVEAARGSAGDPTASAAIEVTVTRHVVVLTPMVDSVPSPARDAINDALSSSTKVLDDLDGGRAWTVAAARTMPTVEVDAAGGRRGRQPNRPASPATRPGAASDEEASRARSARHAREGQQARQDRGRTPATDGQGAGKGAGATGGAGDEDRAAKPKPASLTTRTAPRPIHATPERPDRRCTLT